MRIFFTVQWSSDTCEERGIRQDAFQQKQGSNEVLGRPTEGQSLQLKGPMSQRNGRATIPSALCHRLGAACGKCKLKTSAAGTSRGSSLVLREDAVASGNLDGASSWYSTDALWLYLDVKK